MTTRLLYRSTWMLLSLALVACDSKKDPPAPPVNQQMQTDALRAQPKPADESRAVGTWRAQVGDESKPFYFITVMELRADHTLRVTRTMPDSSNPGQVSREVAEGRWSMTGDTVEIIQERALDGPPIREDQRQRSFTIAPEGSGLKLTDSQGGPAFIKR